MISETKRLKAELFDAGELLDRVTAERDQLKAENEALRQIISDSATSCGAAVSVECSLDFMAQLPGEIFSVISKLRTELAELRKDAERYRFLRRDISNHNVDFCIVKKFWDRSLHDTILETESADAQIDAAMSKEG